jgi:4-amino-4-deoxy-L-arabinose transferase-like glycosyltransferase
MSNLLTDSPRKLLFAILAFTILVRLFTLGAYPLTDNTEARYGEIARKMAETGNWVTPQIDYGVPFWAKPPLSTWLTAASFKAFGVSEFSARIPSFLLLLVTCCLLYYLAMKRCDTDYALTAAVIFATTGLCFYMAGGVMTDPALVVSTTLSMVAFWQALTNNDRKGHLWGYLFFMGLAIGLLAKGPIAGILTLLPIGIWTLWKKKWAIVWQRLPWVLGTIIMLVIALPWYLLAESRTPGFLEYFFIGEHWKRFTENGWRGDLYGTAHLQPYGMIWLLWLPAAFPWSFVLIIQLIKMLKRCSSNLLSLHDEWIAYLLLWVIAPMVFFTFAGNILITYVLPGLPALALLMAEFRRAEITQDSGADSAVKGRGWTYPLLGLTTPVIAVLVIFLAIPHISEKYSHKNLIARYEALRTTTASRLVYLSHRPCSAEFYSRGTAKKLGSMDEAMIFPMNTEKNFFTARGGVIEKLPQDLRARLELVGEYGGYILFRERMKLNADG